jgi:RHS repeat-associated protein
MTDGTGTTTYSHDAAGDVTSQAFSAASGSGLSSNTVGYGYFTTGVLASETYPSYGSYSSPMVSYTYDALGNMASETDWLGNTVSFAHDGDGNLTAQDNEVSSASPNGTSGTTYAYDGADLNATATSSLAASGDLTQSFAGSGGSRNADGEVTEDTETYTNSCSGQGSYERNYSYDLAGRVVYQGSVAQGSNANNFAYGTTQHPTVVPTEISSHVSSGGNFDTYSQTYNSAEAVTAQTLIAGSGGVNSTYGYDAIGDLTSSTSQGATTGYSYDSIAQMTGMSDTAGATSYEYTGDGLEAATSSASWGAMTDIDGTKALWSVSCSSSSFCAAVDNHGDALIYNGSSWTKFSGFDGTVGLASVSCPTATWCMAVDALGYYVTWNGTNWTRQSPAFDSGNGPNAVSCPSSIFCMAVDSKGNALMFSSGNWTSSDIDGANMLTSVSCRASNFCIAVDEYGNAFTYNGQWTKAKPTGDTNALDALSCDSTGFCVAVDNQGNEAIRSGGSWGTSDQKIDGTNSLASVSVISSSFYVVVDDVGNALIYNNGNWTKKDIDGTNSLQSVSCRSTTFCSVVDLEGNVGFYSQSGAEQLIWDTSAAEPLVLSDGTNYYVYGATGEPVEQVNVTTSPPANNPVFLTYTPSDSSWLATNTSGDELVFWRYDAFGTLATGTPDSPFGYAGQYTDTSAVPSGFDNMRARWYQAQTGQFTSVDPDFTVSDQAYEYAGDDPVNEADPSGLVSVPLGAVIAARAAHEAGFRGLLIDMVAIAGAESGWNPGAHRNSTSFYGLWQIDIGVDSAPLYSGSKTILCPGISSNWKEPDANADCAFSLVRFNRIHGWPLFKEWTNPIVSPDHTEVSEIAPAPGCNGVCYSIAKAAVKKAGY